MSIELHGPAWAWILLLVVFAFMNGFFQAMFKDLFRR